MCKFAAHFSKRKNLTYLTLYHAMELDQFIEEIAAEFDDVEDKSSIAAQTKFRNLEGWSSMLALIIVSNIDDLYEVTISAEELGELHTIVDLYEFTKNRQS